MKTRLLIFFLGLILFSLLVSLEQVLISAQAQNPNISVEDPTSAPQDLQSGETLSNPGAAIVIESLGAVLIILFIVIFAIKKRTKGVSKHDNN